MITCCYLLMNAAPAGVQLCSQAVIMYEKQDTISDKMVVFICPWASCQTRKIAGYACAGNAGNVFPDIPRVSDPGMHPGTCMTHVPRCMPGSLTSSFIWCRWRGKHSRCMRNQQFCVSGKRPMARTDISQSSCQIKGVRLWNNELDLVNHKLCKKALERLSQNILL